MAVQRARLPKCYVFAFTGDGAIDWLKSAEMLHLDMGEFEKIEDESQRASAIEAAAVAKYKDFDAVESLPLAARTGEKITRFHCRPLTKDQIADLWRYMTNPYRLALESIRVGLTEVKDWGDEEPYKGVEDLPDDVVMSIGSRIFGANQTSGETRDF